MGSGWPCGVKIYPPGGACTSISGINLGGNRRTEGGGGGGGQFSNVTGTIKVGTGG